MKTVTFKCETITPMFLGGADIRQPEVRPPSIKGALRFWWRAMNGDLVKKINGNWDYTNLKKKETEIFGGVEPEALKSKIILQIEDINLNVKPFNELERIGKQYVGTRSMPALKYIGYGLYDFRDKNKNRKYLSGDWKLICHFDESIEKDIKVALSMLNLFGGLGSKSRNGFGSIQLSSDNFSLYNREELDKWLREKFRTQPGENYDIVPYTAFTKLNIVKEGITSSSISALEEIAIAYYNAKKSTKPNKFIASDKIEELNFERYPKRYYFSVKRTNNNKFKWQCLYLPMLIEDSKYKNYRQQNSKFQENLKSNN